MFYAIWRNNRTNLVAGFITTGSQDNEPVHWDTKREAEVGLNGHPLQNHIEIIKL